MSKPPSSDLTPSAPPPAPVVPRPRLDETRVLDCEVFHYPWDDWERWALAQGLDPAVAGQARLLIREAFQHDWPEELRGLCGWRDDGQALFKLARRAPKKALRQWDILMRTDGLRGGCPAGAAFRRGRSSADPPLDVGLPAARCPTVAHATRHSPLLTHHYSRASHC